ncbi:protein FAM169B [Cololabis saira]|uniref:protein FAM169B n=1 Tax=Cololabis saira TaxID=129043 RepID=UPI002AD2D645|nr:protein FAM169B [Cololabis saira]
MYPVDLPALADTDLTSASEHFLSALEAKPFSNEWFQLSQTSKVEITAANISQLQLFEEDQPGFAVLALHPPDDRTQVVALYLHERWWRLDDVLRTSSKSRSGLVSVQSMTERVIVFLLSQVVERPSLGEVFFSLHPCAESCKVLWRDQRAVGFYTVKHKGSLVDGWSSCCYLLPVLDTVLVRRSCRRRGFGLQILEDFCSWFSSDEYLGVSSPLSPSMAAVFRTFLQQREEHRERLYEVEAPGGWTQRRNIWLGIQLGRYALDVSEESTPTPGHTQEKEGNSLSQLGCETSLTSQSTCNTKNPLHEQKIILPNQRENPTSSTILGTGCSCAAHADNLDSRLPIRTKILKQTLKSKATLSTKNRGSRGNAQKV